MFDQLYSTVNSGPNGKVNMLLGVFQLTNSPSARTDFISQLVIEDSEAHYTFNRMVDANTNEQAETSPILLPIIYP